MKALIFAAGLGTRLAPLTDNCPKALVKVNGRPILDLLIERLKYFGIDYIVINVHHFADQIIKYVNSKDFGLEIHISDERNLLLDTGGGLKNAEKFFSPGDTFLVHNVDIYSDIDLAEFMDFHKRSNNIVSLAVKQRYSSRQLLFDDSMRLCGWRSGSGNQEFISLVRKSYLALAFSGIHVYNYEIFKVISKTGVFPIIPELLEITKKYRVGAFQHDTDFVLDLGKQESIKKLEERLL